MKKYIVALDEGTTSCRVLIFDKKGQIVGKDQIKISTYKEKEGWIEQDALEIWSLQRTAFIQSLNKSGIKPNEIDSIAITNQRETIVVWDAKTGLPVYNAISWQDSRTAQYCDSLENKYKEIIKNKTGLIVSPYFSASKIRWILDNIPNGQKRAENQELLIGNINTWLIYKFTNSEVFATDVTNAARTMLFNIYEQKWDDELLKIFNIPKCALPVIKENADDFGKTESGIFIRNDKTQIPIRASIGDQHASLFGNLCLNQNDTKITYGTGCFILTNTGEKTLVSKHGLLTTIGFKINGITNYALEGSVMVAGNSIEWLKNDLKLIYSSKETEFYASQSEAQESLYVVPAFNGLGAPYWNHSARGLIIGFDFSTKREQLITAFLNSIVYQAQDIIEAIQKDTNSLIKNIKVDGGVIKNEYIMQYQSDISQTEIIRQNNLESSAIGAAFIAGLKTGFWKDVSEIKELLTDFTIKTPTIKEQEVKKILKGWKLAVSKSINWEDDLKGE